MSSRAIVRDNLIVTVADAVPEAGDLVRLAATRCTRCGRLEFPGRQSCPTCTDLAYSSPVGPDATLAAFTAVLHPAPGALIAPPYHVGVARFPEGLCVIGILLNADELELATGLLLETVMFEAAPDRLTYAFRVLGP